MLHLYVHASWGALYCVCVQSLAQAGGSGQALAQSAAEAAGGSAAAGAFSQVRK